MMLEKIKCQILSSLKKIIKSSTKLKKDKKNLHDIEISNSYIMKNFNFNYNENNLSFKRFFKIRIHRRVIFNKLMNVILEKLKIKEHYKSF